MSKIKLNPYVDLGLSADTVNKTVSSSSSNATLDPATPGTTGLTDLSSFTGLMDYNASNMYEATQSEAFLQEKTEVESALKKSFDMDTIFFILVLVLFLASLGALVFFGLQYFKVI